MKSIKRLALYIFTLCLLVSHLSARAQEPVTVAFFSTTNSTAGLCAPATVEFQIGNWFNNSPGTIYVVDFGDGSKKDTLKHPLNGTNSTYLFAHAYTKASCPTPDFMATLKVVNGSYVTTYTLNQIIVREKPTVDFGIPTTCANTPVCFTNLTKNGYKDNSCTLPGDYAWDFGDGTTASGFTPPCHTYTTAGTYTVTLKVSNTACGEDVKSKQIVFRPLSPPPVVTTPVVYCQGQIASPLKATGTGLLWYTVATGGAGTTTVPTPVTTTAGNRTYYVSQTLPNNCESQRAAITVTVNPTPTPPVVTTPVNLCLGQPATALTTTGTDLLWYTDGIGSPTAPTPSTATTGSTIWYVSQANSFGCRSSLATITATVHPVPSPPVITVKNLLCVGDDLVLQAHSDIADNSALNYLWTGPGIDFPARTPNVGITDMKREDAGIYTVAVTSATTGCSTKADTTIQVGDFPIVKFAQDTVILPAGNSLNLVPFIANADKPGVLPIENYAWAPSEDFKYGNAIRSSAVVTIKDNACYTVTATNKYGCSGKGELCVKIRCRNAEIFVPDAFTPAGPIPENRRLMVRTASNNRVKAFKVFNRWGRIVFEKYNFPSNEPSYGWDGKFNGKMADAGVYIYTVDIICENGGLYSFKGNVTLL